jgi:restriction system protein
MGAVPFLVIAVMAARRQWGTPSAARVQQVRDAVSAMAWRDFSAALEAAWRREGYGVAPHEGAGADLVLSRSGTVMLVSGRRWKAASVGVEPLRELAAAMARADARHGVCVTLGAVSAQADQFAQAHGIRFMQDAALAQLLGRKVLG